MSDDVVSTASISAEDLAEAIEIGKKMLAEHPYVPKPGEELGFRIRDDKGRVIYISWDQLH